MNNEIWFKYIFWEEMWSGKWDVQAIATFLPYLSFLIIHTMYSSKIPLIKGATKKTNIDDWSVNYVTFVVDNFFRGLVFFC